VMFFNCKAICKTSWPEIYFSAAKVQSHSPTDRGADPRVGRGRALTSADGRGYAMFMPVCVLRDMMDVRVIVPVH
jgi:hypothetical protein